MAKNNDHWCFAWQAPARRGAAPKSSLWNPGDEVTVSFLDGPKSVQTRVRDAALQWVGKKMANLRLTFNDHKKQPGMIRISFRFNGSWSAVGTVCKGVKDLNQPTMNYGWLKEDSSDTDLNRVVLHEFGHALGLIHEHQNPAGGIQWNRSAVIADLSAPPNRWDAAKIEFNMFKPFDANATNFTALDPKSIMLYPVPSRWTTDGFSTGMNGKLSAADKEFIRKLYPWPKA